MSFRWLLWALLMPLFAMGVEPHEALVQKLEARNFQMLGESDSTYQWRRERYFEMVRAKRVPAHLSEEEALRFLHEQVGVREILIRQLRAAIDGAARGSSPEQIGDESADLGLARLRYYLIRLETADIAFDPQTPPEFAAQVLLWAWCRNGAQNSVCKGNEFHHLEKRALAILAFGPRARGVDYCGAEARSLVYKACDAFREGKGTAQDAVSSLSCNAQGLVAFYTAPHLANINLEVERLKLQTRNLKTDVQAWFEARVAELLKTTEAHLTEQITKNVLATLKDRIEATRCQCPKEGR